MDAYQLVLNTCPDEETAQQLAKCILDEKLAACINIIPGLLSIYEWQGKREQGTEVLLLIKTRQELFTELEMLICSLHPYELPEIIALSINDGLQVYLNWISTQTQQSK